MGNSGVLALSAVSNLTCKVKRCRGREEIMKHEDVKMAEVCHLHFSELFST